MPLALRGITSFVGSFFRCSVAVFCLSVTRRVSEEPEKQSTLIDEFTLLEEVEEVGSTGLLFDGNNLLFHQLEIENFLQSNKEFPSFFEDVTAKN